MSLALREIRRSKLKFGLLTGAVALLVFLVLFLTTLSGALIRSFIGGLDAVSGDVLAYSATARDNIQASRLRPEAVAQVAAVPGVAEAAGLSLGTFTASTSTSTSASASTDNTTDERVDMSLFAADPDGPGAPSTLVEGRMPGDGEIVADKADADAGFGIGDTVTVAGGAVALTVVGLLEDSRFSAAPTAWTTPRTFESIVRAINPAATFVPINAVAVTTAEGTDPAAVAAAITDDVPALQGYTRDEAVAAVPGVASVSQSFNLLVGITFAIVIVVVGFFFLILTVQKMRVFTALRALGAGTGSLAATVAFQVTTVVLLASLLAFGLVTGAVRGVSTGIPVSLDPSTTLLTIVLVLVFALLASLLSVRRIARIDPASAAGAR